MECVRQIGIVVAVTARGAAVEVQRMSACDACHRGQQKAAGERTCSECRMFPTDDKMTVEAVNEIGARVGDRVTIETATEQVLGYAAAVFLLPLLLAVVGGCVFAWLIEAAWSVYVGAMIGFFGAFAAVKYTVDKHAKTKTVYTVIRILMTGCGTEETHAAEDMEN